MSLALAGSFPCFGQGSLNRFLRMSLPQKALGRCEGAFFATEESGLPCPRSFAHLHCTKRTICHEMLTHFKNRVHTAPVGRRRGVSLTPSRSGVPSGR